MIGIVNLSQRSDPLFPLNTALWNTAMISQTGSISVPSGAAPVVAAANLFHQNSPLFNVKESTLTDRIYLMRCAMALPLGAYANCTEYEDIYFARPQSGLHLYEGSPDTMRFNDWRKLPSLTPESHINYASIPLALKQQLEEVQALYDAALSSRLLQGDQVFTLSDVSLQTLRQAMQQAGLAQTRAKEDVQMAEVLYNTALQALGEAIQKAQMVFSGYTLPHGSQADQKAIDTVRKDYFFSSPAVQLMVRESLDVTRQAQEMQNAMAQELEDMRGVGKPSPTSSTSSSPASSS